MRGSKIRRIRSFDLIYRPQVRRWTYDCSFTVTTANQFTDEEYVVGGESRWMLVALWHSWIKARRLASTVAARPGERQRKGWSS
jgi:hypothetical protein